MPSPTPSPNPQTASYQEPKEKSPSPPAAPNQEPKTESLFSAKLKDKLSDEQAELDKHTKASAALKADLAAAEKTEKEIDQIISAYEQALQNLTKERDVAAEYVNYKPKRAETAVGINIGVVKTIIEEDNAVTKTLKSKIDGQPKQIQQAEIDYRQATYQLADAKRAFDDKKAYPAEQTENLKTIRDLTAKADKEDPAHPANVYFLVSEINILFGDTDLKPAKEFKTELQQAVQNFNDATTKARDLKNILDGKVIDLDKDQKAFSERQAKKLDRILKAISKYNEVLSSGAPA